jgi:two-component system, chemotaxis family, protein-glutamate methylesterase/glutaminase
VRKVERVRSEQNRDIIVIGASAGGFEAIKSIIAKLPADLPASVFIAQHISPYGESRFPDLLNRVSRLPAEFPTHGQAIDHGRIYIAPPDSHLVVRYGAMAVTRGPKENGHRPSVDALFRSAARAYGPRVIGVVLSGYLDCGSAGLLSIRAREGLAIAQDPDDAEVPDMPKNAIRQAGADHVVKLDDLPGLLIELVGQQAPPWTREVEPAIEVLEGDRLGEDAELSCPSCKGVLTEASVGDFHQYRCHVGHTFTLQSVLSEQTDETERALWSAVRALEESAALATRVGQRSSGELQKRFFERARGLTIEADIVRRILIGRATHPELAEPEELERVKSPG